MQQIWYETTQKITNQIHWSFKGLCANVPELSILQHHQMVIWVSQGLHSFQDIAMNVAKMHGQQTTQEQRQQEAANILLWSINSWYKQSQGQNAHSVGRHSNRRKAHNYRVQAAVMVSSCCPCQFSMPIWNDLPNDIRATHSNSSYKLFVSPSY